MSAQNRPTIKAGTLTPTRGLIGSVGMSNVLNEEKKQQVIALGRLGWSLRRIEQATGVRRETAGAYLKAVGIAVRPPGAWGRRSALFASFADPSCPKLLESSSPLPEKKRRSITVPAPWSVTRRAASIGE